MKKKISILLLLIASIAMIGIISTKEVKAEDSNEQYSIEYLLRNYNAVTLGQKTNNIIDFYSTVNVLNLAGRGNIEGVNSIDGAILVQGNYTSQNNATFGSQAGSTKSFIKGTKGDNVTTTSELSTDSNFVDFEKMYIQIVNEQQMLIEKSKEHIMGPNIEITSPGIYTINNAATNEYEMNAENTSTVYSGSPRLFIKNYDKNELYIFNSYDEYTYINSMNIVIMEKNSPNSTNLQDLVNSGNYTGNIIFNFPKAKLVFINSSNYNNNYSGGSIIAPKADVLFNTNNYYGSVICNSIFNNAYNSSSIRKANYTVNKSLVDTNSNEYIDEYKDYNDDSYSGSYSISELLQNYSLVTLGKKTIDSKTELAKNGQNAGAVRLFHAAGPVLINGDLYGKISEVPTNGSDYQTYETTRLDLESNTVTESYIKGNVGLTVRNGNGNSYNTSRAYVQDWDNINQSRNHYYGRKNLLLVGTNNNSYYMTTNNYINFDRLYENIITEQSAINEGTKAKNGEDKVTHIPIGGNYVIEDINDVNEIVFDNFDENKDKLTIITVKNSGDINFPLISKDTGSYKGIVTNDYYNKTEVTHPYEVNNLVQDSYHGNIVWNIPNATYIKLKENAPFAGHLIAPKADVETPELHFSGCFIVNSLYAEGNTEAHFYPITIKPDCDCDEYHNLSEDMKERFSQFRLNRLLGGEATTIETTVMGDKASYQEDIKKLESVENHCPSNNQGAPHSVVEILTNPKTYRNLGIILLVVIIVGGSLLISKKKTEKE